MEYLVMRLYGPIASWGDVAIGESRHSQYGPSKSAVMGMVAAALGIKREDEQQHIALNQNYQLATALQSGYLLRDYHTVTAADSVGKFRYRTRRDELTVGHDRLHTVLTSREYRTDAYALIAIKSTEQSPYPLQQLASALLQPVFIPYLGRKACPLAAPLEPQCIEAEDFQSAFLQYQPTIAVHTDYSFELLDYFWEGELNDFSSNNDELSSALSIVSHDQLLSRKRWQFSQRQVFHLHVSEGAHVSV